MIVTVTPNPSLDRTVELPHLRRGEVHRATAVRLDPGGKGVNVARALTAAGRDAVAVLPTGRAPGERLHGLLDVHGVRAATVAIDGATRTNLTLVEPDGATTKINEPGPVLTAAEVAQLVHTAATLAVGASWVVSCGSLPAGGPEDLHADIVRRTRAGGAMVAVDASDAALRAACLAEPDLIKPNHAELATLVDRPLTSLGAVLDAARELRAAGVGAVLVSLGAGGALLVEAPGPHGGGEYHAVSGPVAVRSTVGAGDAALAGFLAAGATGPHALRQAVAYGAAACRLPGSAMPGPHDIDPHDVRVITHPDQTLTLTGATP